MWQFFVQSFQLSESAQKNALQKCFLNIGRQKLRYIMELKVLTLFLEDNQTLINPQEVNIKPKSKELISN